MNAAVPVVEAADDADAPGAGSPHSKVDTADAFESAEVRAELFVSVIVAAFAHEVDVELGEEIGEGVGIVAFEFLAGAGAEVNAIAGWVRRRVADTGKDGFEEAGVGFALHGDGPVFGQKNLRFHGAGLE